MTTPPSSPALSEARDEARAYVMGHRSEPDGPVWPDQRGLAAIDNLIALAHASGLAAGREQRDKEWCAMLNAVPRYRMVKQSNRRGKPPMIEFTHHDPERHKTDARAMDALEVMRHAEELMHSAALRSPVGG